ncbi:hypothetical protein D3C72_1205590 [compost metagenome]
MGQVLEALLRLAPLADVPRHGDQQQAARARGARIAARHGRLRIPVPAQFHGDQAQVAPHQFVLRHFRGQMGRAARQRGQRRGRRRWQQGARRQRQQFVARIAEQAASAVVDVDQGHAHHVDEENGVRGGVHGAAKALQFGRALAHRAFEQGVVVARGAVQQPHFEHVADAREHLERVEGLADEVARARFQRRQLGVRVGGDHQHGQIAFQLQRTQGIHHLVAAHAGHHQVEDDQVELVALVQAGHGARVEGAGDGRVAAALQQMLEQAQIDFLVVDEENFRRVDIGLADHGAPVPFCRRCCAT